MMSLKAQFSLGLSLGVLLATAALTGVANAQTSAPISLFTPGTERTEPPPGEGVRGMRPETVGAVAYFTVSPQASRSLRSPKPGPTQMRIALPGGKAKQFGPLRVLILYTPNAASDSTDIKGEIAVMMRQFNQTLSLNKNFKATAELAAALQVTYTESGDMETDLDRLSGKVPGFFDNVRQIRDKYKADFVHMLIRGSGDACGIGWLLDPQRPGSGDWSFSLADRECAVGNFSFIHEVGHNLGLNHDRAVVSNAGAEEFNFGYVDIAHGIRTVMAYNNACSDVNKNCRRLPVYSTPYLFYKGVVLGKPITDSEGADNAEILCRNAAAATKFAETRAAGQ
jgi:hypothetical protein